MKLTELFSMNKPMESGGKTQEYSAQNAGAVSRRIKALMPGQTIQGEIVFRNGSEVQIKMTDDLVITARLDQNMNLEVGKNMSFEVKNNGRALTLSPLFANTATEANALKALDMASLPVNNSTVSMTKLMMEAGLSIDKNSLQQVYREINVFSNADISDIVDLHKLGMTVNEGNVTQIAAYKNLTHQLTGGIHQVLEALPDTFQGMLQAGNIGEAAGLYQELLALVEAEWTEGGTVSMEEGIPNQAGQTASMKEGIPNQAGQTASMKEGIPNQAGQAASMEEGILNGAGQAAVMEARAILSAETVDVEGILLTEGQTLGGLGGSRQDVELASALNNVVAGMPLGAEEQELLNQINLLALGRMNTKEQLLLVNQVIGRTMKHGSTEPLRELLGGKALQQLLGKSLQQLWTITPNEVADAKQVGELYQKLDRQLKGIARALESAGQSNSTAHQAVTGMSRNVDFLQQFNQMYTYVQLPLRLNQGEAHGDLYVYTNKKNLAQKDGQISALLHLDMEHLGPLDVYVVMQAERVNTKFYVQDDEMLDFLEAHMNLLTERLQKRGYSCSMDMQVRKSGESVKSGVKPILEQDNHTPLAQYAFDVRA